MLKTSLAGLAGAALLSMIPASADAGCGGYGYGGYGASYGAHYGGYSAYATAYTPRYRPRHVVVHKPVVVHRPIVVTDHCTHPHHCYTWVRPGDSLDVICLREYGDASLWRQVAEYNGFAHGGTLSVGRPLMLPSIYASGRMIASSAPAPAAFAPVAAPIATALALPPAAPPIAQ